MSEAPKKASFGLEDLEEFRARLVQLRAELDPPTQATDYLAYTDGACFGNPAGPGGWGLDVHARRGESVTTAGPAPPL